jgi:hypothetical protein
MAITDIITSADENRFMELQKDGLVPALAYNKLQAEKRLGIEIPAYTDESTLGIKNSNLGFYLTLTAIGAGIIYVYSKSSSTSTTPITPTLNTIENINGIDLHSLNICKLKGLM